MKEYKTLDELFADIKAETLADGDEKYILGQQHTLWELTNGLKRSLARAKTDVPAAPGPTPALITMPALSRATTKKTVFARDARGTHRGTLMYAEYDPTPFGKVELLDLPGDLNYGAILKSLEAHYGNAKSLFDRSLTPVQADLFIEWVRHENPAERCIYLVPIRGYDTAEAFRKGSLDESDALNFYCVTAFEAGDDRGTKYRYVDWEVQFGVGSEGSPKHRWAWTERNYENVRIPFFTPSD